MIPGEAKLISNIDQNWAHAVSSYRNFINKTPDPGRRTPLIEILGSETKPSELARLMVSSSSLANTVKFLAWAALGEVLLRTANQIREENRDDSKET